ncbi:Membrane proteinase PrsW, cleaves anti-sigma factor RsiW, M82 family [Lentzea xinjiangensis]|uniref:Membrane proteinase PrsW, cleaves anti-sigma factor RsiW, M82 family n=1 Tax=Lentzea xinjiangensis TaxID=402600 RepID=A0A1H9RIR6_9PSEU|nr:PrsW family glutamic-type intramembrane protease [Lentzea xinjiangensis]SER72642.1 Membrane proteinase PrsW, cleaves anti-sigma factor RsiW, M82 family [Lentzea xinjiangensis]
MALTGTRSRPWLRMFLIGLALWVATVVITYVTQNTNLIPTIVLLGSFLVPATFVSWAFGHRHSGEVTGELVFRTFAVGGVLGVLGASLLESYLLHPSPWLFVGVGLIEEAVKLAALALLTRHLTHKSARDGLVLGAGVGFGFAAFESAGYALTAMFTQNGLSLIDLVTTELLRGLLAPFGHGLWTAILGAVLFSRSTREHFLLTGRLLVAYLGVSLLHALWDSMNTIAVVVTLVLTGQRLPASGYPGQPTSAQVELFTVFTWTGLAVISALGLVWLAVLVRASRRTVAPVVVRGYPVSTDARWWPAGRPPR